MRFNILILLSLLSVAFLATIAFGVNWDNPDSQTIDEMLSSGEVSTYLSKSPGQAATPKEQRIAEANKSSLNWEMPSSLNGGGDTAKESRDLAGSKDSEDSQEDTATKETSTKATTESELPPSQSNVASVGGSWSLSLTDSVERNLALIIFQNKEFIFGAGKIKEGNNTLDVTISGSVQNETMDMDLVSLGTIGLYKLKLNLAGEYIAGDYQAFYTSGETQTGNVEGQKTG